GVLLADHPAGGVALRPVGRAGHVPAHGVGDRVDLLAHHVLAAGDPADLLARHPDRLAHPPPGALHAVGDDRAGAVGAAAAARVEVPGAGLPAALLDHGAGDVLLLRLPAAGVHHHSPLRVDRLAAVGLVGVAALLGHRLPRRHRHHPRVRLVDGLPGGV